MPPSANITLENLPKSDQKAVMEAKAAYDFVVSKLSSNVSNSKQEAQRFADAPTQYLQEAGCPGLSKLSRSQRGQLDKLLANIPVKVGDDGCWACVSGMQVAIIVIIAIGVVVVAAAITALAAMVVETAGLALPIVLGIIGEVGIAVGNVLLAPQVASLARGICKEMGKCR